MVTKSCIHSSALPCLVPEGDYEYFFVTLKVDLTTLQAKFSVLVTFLEDGVGRDTQNMDRQTFLGKHYFR